MKATITNKLLKSLTADSKPYDVRDVNLKGFLVRVNTSGKLVYMCEYARAKRIMLGQVGVMSLTVARDKAKEVINDARNGIDPKKKREEVHGKKDDRSLRNRFCEYKKFTNIPLSKITLPLLEEWCAYRRKSARPETINRNVASLRSRRLCQCIHFSYNTKSGRPVFSLE